MKIIRMRFRPKMVKRKAKGRNTGLRLRRNIRTGRPVYEALDFPAAAVLSVAGTMMHNMRRVGGEGGERERDPHPREED